MPKCIRIAPAAAFAVLAVALMLSTPLCVPCAESDGDIVPGNFQDYGYKLYYNSDNIQVAKVQSVSADGASTDIYSTTNTGRISSFWDFDPDTGIGPFNCFYAAINLTDREDPAGLEHPKESTAIGQIGYVLNPYSLGSTIYGEEITASEYNTMLVVPTVYWYSDSDNNILYITNDPGYAGFPSGIRSNLVAYAHTVRVDSATSIVAPYIAYGVYEGLVDSSNRATSQPSSSLATRISGASSVRYAVTNDNVPAVTDSGNLYMLWDAHQWTLYKIMAYSILGNKLVQNIQMSNGSSYGEPSLNSNRANPGTTADTGPYSYNNASIKVLLENAVGARWDLVDQLETYINGENHRCYRATNYAGAIPSSKTYVFSGVHTPWTTPSSNNWGYVQRTVEGSSGWDLPDGESKTGSGSTYQNAWYKSNSPTGVFVGAVGSFNSFTLNNSDSVFRLAYVMQGSSTVSFGYGDTGDTGTGTLPSPIRGLMSGMTVTVPGNTGGMTNVDPNKEFLGWKLDGTLYTPGDELPVKSGNVMMESYWAPMPATVTFDPNGGEGEMDVQKIPFDMPTPLRANIFTRDGYVFSKWTGEDAEGNLYEFTDKEPVSLQYEGSMLSIDLYAQWQERRVASFDIGSGSASAPADIASYAGGIIKLPSYRGMSGDKYFAGWKCQVDGKKYSPGDSYVMPAGDVPFKALYAPGHTMSYSASHSDSILPDPRVVPEGNRVTITSIEPERTGYAFHGWRVMGSIMHPGDTFAMPAFDVTATAVWESIYVEDDDDILDILHGRASAAAATEHEGLLERPLDWMPVVAAAVLSLIAGCLVFVARRPRPTE